MQTFFSFLVAASVFNTQLPPCWQNEVDDDDDDDDDEEEEEEEEEEEASVAASGRHRWRGVAQVGP